MSKEFALIDELEEQGQWEQALLLLREKLLCEGIFEANGYHQLGRLYQRLGQIKQAKRAYLKSLAIEPNRAGTLNNLSLLELHQLDPNAAEMWLKKGLSIPALSIQESELLHATACELRLFQLKPKEALDFVETQLRLKVSVMALSNKAVCLDKLDCLDEAIDSQKKAINLHIKQFAPQLSHEPFKNLVYMPCGSLNESIQLQLQLMNLGIFLLSRNLSDQTGHQLLMAGTANDAGFWMDPRRRETLWKGNYVKELILWDDQGYGDTIQNLVCLEKAAQRAKKIRLWLRPSLVKLFEDRFSLPSNCFIETMSSDAMPWSENVSQLGLFFLPIITGGFSKISLLNSKGYLKRNKVNFNKNKKRVGLVWSAGKHTAPQPERSARARDLPFDLLWGFAKKWKRIYDIEFSSLQLEGHQYEQVSNAIKSGNLLCPVKSKDWLNTAKVLETLDLLISVDTSVAHLSGALGIPTILMLSSPADFRWGREGTKTPIYESFEIARCLKLGDWENAFSQADLIISRRFS